MCLQEGMHKNTIYILLNANICANNKICGHIIYVCISLKIPYNDYNKLFTFQIEIRIDNITYVLYKSWLFILCNIKHESIYVTYYKVQVNLQI